MPDSDDTIAKDFEEHLDQDTGKIRWKNLLILCGVGILACVVILAIVIPVCIENDCSGLLSDTSTTAPTTTAATTAATTTKPTTTRTTITTTTRPPATTTTVTTTTPTPSTTTSRSITLPTLTPPSTAPAPRDVTVNTAHGPVTGHVISSPGIQSIISYLGIPFAKPPVLDLRWEKPQDPDPWVSPYVANTLKPQCIQTRLAAQITHLGYNDFNEDCLYLNVYTPQATAGEPYPVMVWIYGGGFGFGGNLQYPGHFLAAENVVMVALTYRTNVFGYLSTDEPLRHSNFGMWDQVKALQWVQDNIRNFGGDPDQVTIFGESAGGASCGLQIVSPASEGLVHQAILQSGCDLSPWVVDPPEREPWRRAEAVAEDVGCGGLTDNDAMLFCMRQVDANTIYRSRPSCPGCPSFGPIVDGDGGFLPKMPRQMRMDDNYNIHYKNISVMLGVNSDESAIFLAGVMPGLLVRDLYKEEFDDIMASSAASKNPVDPGMLGDLQEAHKWMYTPWPLFNDSESLKNALAQPDTDSNFGIPGNNFLVYHNMIGGKAYQYEFDLATDRLLGFPWPEWIGTPHMWELPYVFGYPLIAQASDELQIDTGNLSLPLIRYSARNRAWSRHIISMWTNFAKNGDPTPVPMTPPSESNPVEWEPYTDDKRDYMYMQNDLTEMRKKFRPLQSSYWNNYLDWMANDGELHKSWEWDGPQTTSFPVLNSVRNKVKGNHDDDNYNPFVMDELIETYLEEIKKLRNNRQ